MIYSIACYLSITYEHLMEPNVHLKKKLETMKGYNVKHYEERTRQMLEEIEREWEEYMEVMREQLQ